MRKDDALSVGQVRVLQWVNDGCPDGVWRDFTYKTTAYALAARGLVKVDRRRKYWSATITDEGEFYLAHGGYSSNPAAAATNRSSAGSHSDADALATEILTKLMSGQKKLVVAAPSEPQRARYRRAIHRLINSDQIPEGFALKHMGRDRGDLAIRLVREIEESRPEPTPTVSVPDSMVSVTDDVRALGAGVLISVTDASMDRALRILQAIANESATRGWTLELKPTDDRKLRISTPECLFDMSLSEEFVDRELPDDEQLSAAKYAWQRLPLHMRKVGSGRLTLQLGHYWQTKSWSDRRRWTLDDKLGAAFVELERRVAEAAEQRLRREEDLLRRQQAWDAAALAAQQEYVVDLNRRRLRGQVANHANAQAFRAYADTLNTLAEGSTDPTEAASIRQWKEWANCEASRVDPVNSPSTLHYLQPDTVRPEDYGPFMPKGMSPHGRPTQ